MKKIRIIFLLILFGILFFLYKSQKNFQIKQLKNVEKILYSKDNQIVYSFDNNTFLFNLANNKSIKFPIKSSDSKVIGIYEENIFFVKNTKLYSTANLKKNYSLDKIEDLEILDKFIKIKKNGKFGILNSNLEEIIPIQYENILKGEKLFLAKKNNKFGYINFQGKEQIPFEYDYATLDKSESMIVSKNKRAGVIDLNNKIIISFNYNYLIYNNHIALARDGQKFFLVKNNAPFELDISWLGLNNDKTIFYEKDKKFGLMSLDGNKLTDNIYDEILQKNIDAIIVKKDEKYGLINQEGKELTNLKYDYLYPLNDYFFLGLLENTTEEILINSKGKEIMKISTYKELKELSQNYLILTDIKNKAIYFRNGKKIDYFDEILIIQKDYLIYEYKGKIKKLKL